MLGNPIFEDLDFEYEDNEIEDNNIKEFEINNQDDILAFKFYNLNDK